MSNFDAYQSFLNHVWKGKNCHEVVRSKTIGNVINIKSFLLGTTEYENLGV